MRQYLAHLVFFLTGVCVVSACGTAPPSTVQLSSPVPYPVESRSATTQPVLPSTPAAGQHSFAYPGLAPDPTAMPLVNPPGVRATTSVTATLTPLTQSAAARTVGSYPPHLPVRDIQFLTTRHGFGVGIAQTQAALLETTDGGHTWAYRGPLPPDCSDLGVHFLTVTQGWAWGHQDQHDHTPVALCGTDDGGQTWRVLSQFPEFGYGTVAIGDATTLYLSGPSVPLLRSSDGGSSFMPVAPADPTSGQVQFVSPRVGWALRETSLMRTTDGGSTWERIAFGYPVADFAAVSAQGVWVYGHDCQGDFCTPLLLRTDDGGATWTRYIVETPTSQNYLTTLQALTFVDMEHGWFYHGSQALWSTTDGGVTWQQLP